MAAWAPAIQLRRWQLAKATVTSDLPPCGGDARQGRGGCDGTPSSAAYLPFHTGSRFSAKARKPSILSSEP
ncbi:hypothetical protein CK218_14940 [Mesorhizobium sp. WSM3879]|nr:hypothetical protein CK218_14940 [Mesorhizobium sp. WSM3879]PBB91874.1 hypothetical protein CK215_13015 [Mesorhizobium sp. WSM3864]